MKNNLFVLGFGLAIIVFIGCKKDEEIVEPITTPTTTYGSVELELEHMFSSSPFSLGTAFTSTNGEELTFNTAKYYISNVKLTKTDGTSWAQPESYYLVDLSSPSSAMLHLHDVPTGDYTDLSFTVGVDSTRNVSGAQSGALSVSNSMFWSWNSGYIFIKLEGNSPSAPAGNFTYHIGGFSYLNNSVNSGSYSFAPAMLMVRQDATPVVHMTVDIEKTFSGPFTSLEVAQLPTVTMPNANAVKISDNFFSGISFEHIHN